MIKTAAKNQLARIKLASYYYAITHELRDRGYEPYLEKQAFGAVVQGARGLGLLGKWFRGGAEVAETAAKAAPKSRAWFQPSVRVVNKQVAKGNMGKMRLARGAAQKSLDESTAAVNNVKSDLINKWGIKDPETGKVTGLPSNWGMILGASPEYANALAAQQKAMKAFKLYDRLNNVARNAYRGNKGITGVYNRGINSLYNLIGKPLRRRAYLRNLNAVRNGAEATAEGAAAGAGTAANVATDTANVAAGTAGVASRIPGGWYTALGVPAVIGGGGYMLGGWGRDAAVADAIADRDRADDAYHHNYPSDLTYNPEAYTRTGERAYR